MFLEEEDHQHKGRVTSSKMGFQELLGGREDESYEGNTRTFWNILLSIREFQFLTF